MGIRLGWVKQNGNQRQEEREKFGWERVGDKGGVEEGIEVGKERVIPDEESLDLVN